MRENYRWWAMKQFVPADKPWTICRLGASQDKTLEDSLPLCYRIIRRYTNRQDAEDDLRIMTRFVKDGGQYVVAFDSAALSSSLRASVVEVE